MSYVAQEAWIQNLRLIDNVLFDSVLTDAKYVSVMDSSQLSQDLLSLPHADYTSIGERGINLSGGSFQNCTSVYVYI